ncbi:MAG: sulfatase-like hydrolase/transferase [Planctomycetota bacterium]
MLLCILLAAPSHTQPNVLIILADDLGHDDVGVNNPLAPTPNLDRLAADSARLDRFYVHIKCAPSRASLLTGRHFLRTGVWGVHGGRDFLRTDETTIADLFREAGYDTAMMGKWHSGLGDRYYPWQRGFDLARMAKLYRYTGEEGAAESVNGKLQPIEGWAEEHFTNTAIDYLRQPRDKPFFLYLPYMSPHSPWRAPKNYRERFRKEGYSEDLSAFWGMVAFLDHQVGRVLDTLDETGLAENTIVVFLSDNGPVNNGAHRPPTESGKPYVTKGSDWRLRNPHGLRGGKGQVWENGIRSVLFLRWPGHVPATEHRVPVIVEDLLPTLLNLAGISQGDATTELDGISLASTLRNAAASPVEPADRYLFFSNAEPKDSFDPWKLGRLQTYQVVDKTSHPERFTLDRMEYAIQHGGHKLVRFKNQAGVYSLTSDQRERKPVGNESLNARLRSAAESRWKDILSAPHAFERPAIYVDPQRGVPSIIQMRSATRTHGVELTAHDLRGWNRVGDQAVFDLVIEQSLSYQVYLLAETTEITGAKLTVRFKNSTPGALTATIDRLLPRQREHPIFGYDPENCLSLGEVSLPPGHTEMKMTLTHLPPGSKSGVKAVHSLILIPSFP